MTGFVVDQTPAIPPEEAGKRKPADQVFRTKRAGKNLRALKKIKIISP